MVRWRGFLARSVEDRNFVVVDNISDDGVGVRSDFGGYKMGERFNLVMEIPPKPGIVSKATVAQATVTIVFVVAEAKSGQFRIGLKIVDMNEAHRAIFRQLLA